SNSFGQDEGIPVRRKTEAELALAADKRRAPVRVKLRRVKPNPLKKYSPDCEGKKWWAHLKKALGTTSSAFINASLLELQSRRSIAIRWDFGSRNECRVGPD